LGALTSIKGKRMIIEVYTKKDCTYCVQAKRLLEKSNLEYIEREITSDVIRSELLERAPQVKMVPQIFIDNVHIGSFTDLVEHMKKIDLKQ